MTGGGASELAATGVDDGAALDVIGLDCVVDGDEPAEAPTGCANDVPQAVSSRPANITLDAIAQDLNIPIPSVPNPVPA